MRAETSTVHGIPKLQTRAMKIRTSVDHSRGKSPFVVVALLKKVLGVDRIICVTEPTTLSIQHSALLTSHHTAWRVLIGTQGQLAHKNELRCLVRTRHVHPRESEFAPYPAYTSVGDTVAQSHSRVHHDEEIGLRRSYHGNKVGRVPVVCTSQSPRLLYSYKIAREYPKGPRVSTVRPQQRSRLPLPYRGVDHSRGGF